MYVLGYHCASARRAGKRTKLCSIEMGDPVFSELFLAFDKFILLHICYFSLHYSKISRTLVSLQTGKQASSI